MIVLRQEVEVSSRSDTVTVWALGDLHLGNALAREDLIARTVQAIAEDPNARWVGMGDYADFISRHDPRHRESRISSWLHGVDDIAAAQRDRVIKMLLPIADKCLALVKGNHEDTILHHHEVDVYMPLVEAIRAAGGQERLALGVQGFVHLILRRGNGGKDVRRVVLYLHHGYVGGRLAGAKALELERVLMSRDCHVAILAHSHGPRVVVKRPYLRSTDSLHVVEETRVALMAGCFLPGHGHPESYAELKGLPPSDLGASRVEIRAFQGKKGELSIEAVV